MDIAATTNSVTGTTAAAKSDAMAGITGTDFMNLLIKQLQYQDPFKPMGNEEMLAQMSTIRELEMNTRLSNNLQTLTDQQRFGAAASLIGKYVKGQVADASGNTFDLEGKVKTVRFTESGAALLELEDGQILPLQNLQQVSNVEAEAA